MNDFFDLADRRNNTTVYYADTTLWKTWQKPKGCKFVNIFAIGSGGGGAGGQTGALGTNRVGGGGGGGGGIFNILIPSIFLPDTLYISVGVGGAGGSANTSGSNGTDTQINTLGLIPSIRGRILFASRGNAGNVNSNPGSIQANVPGIYGRVSLSSLINGSVGATGGSGTTGFSINPQIPLTGGAGGGSANTSNTSFAGGSIVGTGKIPTIQGGQTAGRRGQNGFLSVEPTSLLSSNYPILFTGGAGGAGNGTGVGGAGGDGAYGCGGGGGGGGTTGGVGGKGGDGLVIITCW